MDRGRPVTLICSEYQPINADIVWLMLKKVHKEIAKVAAKIDRRKASVEDLKRMIGSFDGVGSLHRMKIVNSLVRSKLVDNDVRSWKMRL